MARNPRFLEDKNIVEYIRKLVELEDRVLSILESRRQIGRVDFGDVYDGFNKQKRLLINLMNYIQGMTREQPVLNPTTIVLGSREMGEILYKRSSNLKEDNYRTLSIISIILSLAFLSYLSFNTSNTGMITSIGFSSASIAASLFLFLVSLFLLLKSKIFKKH
ncbi:MAG: hypothetical protein KQA41_03820 [Candidatus Aenigmarchaeota archaeon]|nr:hypothetical protein [Candidatus Aenigmarchaeota archaeon]